jgi:hypothetical protein
MVLWSACDSRLRKSRAFVQAICCRELRGVDGENGEDVASSVALGDPTRLAALTLTFGRADPVLAVLGARR